MMTPNAANDERFLRRTALFDKTTNSNGKTVIRRLPYNIVQYKQFPEMLEPVDINVNRHSTQTDKHVTDLAFVEEGIFYRAGAGLSKGGPTGPLRA
jgi:hypothetical protein